MNILLDSKFIFFFRRTAKPFLILLILLASCASCRMAFAQHANNRTLDIIYIGDSITYGVLLPDRNVESPPANCTNALRRDFHGAYIYMSNQGRSGHTTIDFLPSTQTDFPQVETAAMRLEDTHPGTLVFSVMLGTNDSANSGPDGAPVSTQKYAANLEQIFARLLRDFPQSLIIIQRPTWYSPNTYNAADYEGKGLRRLESYFPEIRSVVKSFTVSNPGHVYAGRSSAFRYFEIHHLTVMAPQSGQRGIFYFHPNARGAVVLGDLWAASIQAVLQIHFRH